MRSHVLLWTLAWAPFAGAEPLSARLGCVDFIDRLWTDAYEIGTEELARTNRIQDLSADLARRALDEQAPRILSRSIARRASGLIHLIAIEGPARLGASTRSERQEAIANLELGDRSDSVRARLQFELRAQTRGLERIIRAARLTCAAPVAAPALADLDANTGALVVAGGRRVFGTIYQSCRALAADPLTTTEPPVEGIAIIGTHPDGVENRRLISDRERVNLTHHYLRAIGTVAAGCTDARENPPIYDYGGKPDTDSGDLNLFKDAGTGTSVLGIDCSGYVYSALAVKGLKLKKSGSLKASGVHGIRAVMYSNPAANGLDCFARVRFDRGVSPAPGDIVAKSGHVFLIDEVGADPFGLARVQRLEDCTAANLSHTGFDFTLLQSDPSGGGTGVNRMHANDYLGQSETMRAGLVAHAVEACKGKFRGTATIPDTVAYIVRHEGTAECRDQPVALRRDSCVNACAR